ncbi:hypothetical protein CK203_009223 [Vitis vinifera]|uniref:Uncharacterized protein n=1 Tax=Vitis vinifera TaxID=29760 RepID=A0A438K2N1_VITVI|nr:hypothetical protein CK203_076816 [Vitis vinifera]RVX15441.1 hypothetical protein CK203_009223 [Vitis vinifera]
MESFFWLTCDLGITFEKGGEFVFLLDSSDSLLRTLLQKRQFFHSHRAQFYDAIDVVAAKISPLFVGLGKI